MEEFKKIEGFENYSISNFGNVRNDKKNKLLKQYDSKGYKIVNLKGKMVSVHRLVGEAFIPNPENKPLIDHKNNNRSDNNVNNLRWATHSENNFNSSMSIRNTSGIKGVKYHKRDERWRAEIGYNGKIINIGSFKTKEEAIKARLKEAKRLFKDYINECEIQTQINMLKMEKERELKELEELERELQVLIK